MIDRENDRYYPVYNRVSKYLDVAERTRILNTRLEVISNILNFSYLASP
jgi:uncharacterized Rmd1/YagE family protein